ncbi:DinB family protein [Luteolibacter soli]|uniref:DinB family protein n=1 Tax=Luteolibacter soli TaxID=3135280 RepID=A0ABU9AXJ1_9BACT
MKTTDNASPQSPVALAPPGAGLPWLEKKMLGYGLGLYSKVTDRERAMERFLGEAESVLSLATPLSEEEGRRAVLVKRLRGMEDSSRYWSPYMIVQHLVIVDKAMLMMIRMLSAGKTTDRKSSTADVKPSPDAGPEALDEFRELLVRWQETLSGIPDLRSGSRHPHPWFGPLDAHGWSCVAGLHHGIHRRQMEAVLRDQR